MPPGARKWPSSTSTCITGTGRRIYSSGAASRRSSSSSACTSSTTIGKPSISSIPGRGMPTTSPTTSSTYPWRPCGGIGRSIPSSDATREGDGARRLVSDSLPVPLLHGRCTTPAAADGPSGKPDICRRRRPPVAAAGPKARPTRTPPPPRRRPRPLPQPRPLLRATYRRISCWGQDDRPIVWPSLRGCYPRCGRLTQIWCSSALASMRPSSTWEMPGTGPGRRDRGWIWNRKIMPGSPARLWKLPTFAVRAGSSPCSKEATA
mmetsp:Transcript_40372/g.94860  ORF Transcript_40372/g.94860 Transcript_40372/m.94860 type:complete len:263 (-) Transcript_40372:379-1167(-)